jgi:hypothetical protein
VESSCELDNEPSGSIKCWELPSGCTSFGLSSGTQLHRVSCQRGSINMATSKHYEHTGKKDSNLAFRIPTPEYLGTPMHIGQESHLKKTWGITC